MAYRVLVVDDSRMMRDMVAKAVAMSGLDIAATDTAGDGREALAKLRAGWFDLVLLDINMPVMNGTHFLKVLRAHARFRTLPVVALTTSTDLETVRRAYEFGANAVVNKVDSLDGMSEIVNTIVDFWFRVARRYFLD